MLRFLPLSLLAALTVGCAKGGDVQSSADAQVNEPSIVDADGDGVTEIDVTPDVDLPDLDADDDGVTEVDLPDLTPDLDKNDDGRVTVDMTPDVDVDLPDLDADNDGVPEIDIDEDNDGIVEIDMPDLTPDIDLPDLDADDDGRVEVDLPDIDMPDVDLPDVGLPDVDLDDVSASCPAYLNGVDLEILDTPNGVQLTFTTNDDDDVTALRQLVARMAMDHTIARDGLPDLTARTVRVRGKTKSGDDFTITAMLPPDQLERMHRSYGQVVGVEDGARLILEPRNSSDVGEVQQMGESFAGKLEDRCEVDV